MTAVVLRSTLPAPSVGTGRRRSCRRRVPVVLRVRELRSGAASQGRRLLRVLLLRTSKCPPMQAGRRSVPRADSKRTGCSESPRRTLRWRSNTIWSSSERTAAIDGGAAHAIGGRTVAVVDFRPFGGTCALRGCDPKKMLNGGTSTVDQVRACTQTAWPARCASTGALMASSARSRPRSAKKERELCRRWHRRLSRARTLHRTDLPRHRRDEVRAGMCARDGRRAREARHCRRRASVTSEQFLEFESLPRRIVLVGGGTLPPSSPISRLWRVHG